LKSKDLVARFDSLVWLPFILAVVVLVLFLLGYIG